MNNDKLNARIDEIRAEINKAAGRGRVFRQDKIVVDEKRVLSGWTRETLKRVEELRRELAVLEEAIRASSKGQNYF